MIQPSSLVTVAGEPAADILVEQQEQRFRMYYPSGPAAASVAFSRDGLHFESRNDDIPAVQTRAFRWGPYLIFVDVDGRLWRSPDGVKDFENGGTQIGDSLSVGPGLNLFHFSLLVRDWTLWMFFSRVNDEGSSIQFSSMSLYGDDARKWLPRAPITALSPEKDYEAGHVADPYVFKDGKRFWLLYTVGDGKGIAAAELKEL